MKEPRTNRLNLLIQNVPLEQVQQNRHTARIHPPKKIFQLARSIDKHGIFIPVIIDEGSVLLSGHARFEAARELGMVEIPAICVTHLSDEEKRAFTLADNRLAELASWDEAILKQELRFLAEFDIDFDFSAIGFDTAEVDILLDDQDAEQDEIEAALISAAGQASVSKLGDLWKAGQHAVFCGDARQTHSYEAVIAGSKANMVFTDSPYNVPIDGHVSRAAANKHRNFAMAAGEMTSEAFTIFLSTIFAQLALFTIDGAIIFACMDWRHGLEIVTAGKLFSLKNICVWVKNNAGMGSLYRSQHEFIYVFKNGTAEHINNVELGKHGRNRTNVWNYQGYNSFGRHRDELLRLHPTAKPVALVSDAIKDCSRRGDLILDPFGGSGTTLIAAEKTRRRAAVIEIDPLYVDVTIRRWQQLTGKSAICVADGLTFAEREIRAEPAPACAPNINCQVPAEKPCT